MNTRLHKQSQQRRKLHVRITVKTSTLPRLVVTRTNKYIYAQVIDKVGGKVLAHATDMNAKDLKGTKTERAQKIGEMVAQKAKAAKVTKVVFDRGMYKYHGR